MAYGEGYAQIEGQRYTGRNLENDVFGSVDVRNPDYLTDLAKAAEPESKIDYQSAIDLVKRHQPGNPANPDKDFLRELIFALQDRLGIDPKNTVAIKAYTAVGTPLDVLYGVDAFVSAVAGGRETIVTLDATLRKDKLAEGHKADIIVGEPPDATDDEDAYLAAIDDIAGRIAKIVSGSSRPLKSGGAWRAPDVNDRP